MLGIATAVSRTRTPESRSSGVCRTPRGFHYDAAPKFLVLNTDANYGLECPAPSAEDHTRATSTEIPWQNGVAEGCVGSCRRGRSTK